jgi:hypothetical protein
MTNREVKTLFTEISPNPGFILDLTKSELSDLVYDTVGLELEDYQSLGQSSGKMLQSLLLESTDEVTNPLVAALKAKKDNNES